MKISCAAFASGRFTLTLRSRRPGRSTAGSIRSWRLLAPITITFFSDSTPSISDRNCATTVASMSEEMPDPRMRNSESISSKKITTGTSSLRLLARAA